MKSLKLPLALAFAFAAGCSGPSPGPGAMMATPCGTVGPTGMTVSAYNCAAISVTTQTGDLTRVVVNSGVMDGDDLRPGSVTVNLKGLVHDAAYKTGDPLITTYKGQVTRVSDGTTWNLAYDATDPTKAQGSLTLTVKMLAPNPSSSMELELHGHLTASYAPAGTATPAPAPLTLDLDY